MLLIFHKEVTHVNKTLAHRLVGTTDRREDWRAGCYWVKLHHHTNVTTLLSWLIPDFPPGFPTPSHIPSACNNL